jgi:hypothetical protein
LFQTKSLQISDNSPCPLKNHQFTPKQGKSNHHSTFRDKGESSLYNLERKPKDHFIFEALGDVDELNANLGLSSYYCTKSKNELDEKLSFVPLFHF